MTTELYLIGRACGEALKPLPSKVLQHLIEATFPEVRRISAASCQQERESAVQQLWMHLFERCKCQFVCSQLSFKSFYLEPYILEIFCRFVHTSTPV